MTETETVTRIAYESVECGRCGGSGHYSYNQLDGTRCYGCNGSGYVLTDAGRAAKGALDAYKAEHFTIDANELRTGDRFVDHDKPRTMIADARTDALNPQYVRLDTQRVAIAVPHGTRVQLTLTPERFAQLVEYARTVEGVVLTGDTP